MTKLVEWLSVLGAFVAIWYSLLVGKVELQFVKQNYNFILYSPLILIALFGFYAAFVVLYRTLTFNECTEAATELKKDIQDARNDLTTLGFVFK